MVDFSTNYLTSLHIVSFSALRYAAIKWPFFDVKLSKRMVIGYIIVLWILSVIFALPMGYLMGVDPKRGKSGFSNELKGLAYNVRVCVCL